jgi:hypothetical protein
MARPGRYKCEVLPRYPHFGAEDKLVWDRWLKSLATCAIGVDYDVRVGPGLPVDPTARADMQRDWLLLTQLRIDAVVYWDAVTWIVEVKPRLIPSALGQVLSYGYWFQQDVKPVVPVELVCIVERTDPQLAPVFTRWGVRVLEA